MDQLTDKLTLLLTFYQTFTNDYQTLISIMCGFFLSYYFEKIYIYSFVLQRQVCELMDFIMFLFKQYRFQNINLYQILFIIQKSHAFEAQIKTQLYLQQQTGVYPLQYESICRYYKIFIYFEDFILFLGLSFFGYQQDVRASRMGILTLKFSNICVYPSGLGLVVTGFQLELPS